MTKPAKWHVCPEKTQISMGICPVWSVFAVCMKKAWVLSYPLSAQPRLIRLGRCWSESSLGAQSLCWFCHVMAQFPLIIWACYWYLSRSTLKWTKCAQQRAGSALAFAQSDQSYFLGEALGPWLPIECRAETDKTVPKQADQSLLGTHDFVSFVMLWHILCVIMCVYRKRFS